MMSLAKYWWNMWGRRLWGVCMRLLLQRAQIGEAAFTRKWPPPGNLSPSTTFNCEGKLIHIIQPSLAGEQCLLLFFAAKTLSCVCRWKEVNVAQYQNVCTNWAKLICSCKLQNSSLQVSPKESASLQLICLHLRPHGADFANGAFEQLGRHVCCLRPQFRIYLGAAPMGKSRDCLACWLLWAPPLRHHPHTFLIITTSTFQLLSSGSQPFWETSTWANTKLKCIRLIILSS